MPNNNQALHDFVRRINIDPFLLLEGEFLVLDMRLVGRDITQPGNIIGHEQHRQGVTFPGTLFPAPERLDEASATHIDGHARVDQ